MKNLLFLLAGIATIAFTGCDNDDDDVARSVEPSASNTEIIASNSWIMESAVQVENGEAIDLFEAQALTARDDVFRFDEHGEALRAEGATREEGASDVVDIGTWSFVNEEKDLKVELESLPVNDQIVELSRSKLVLRKFDGERETVTTFLAE